ncbi:uncharacterized protein RJT20DRAFT_6904 [Scheffersomyces xylosifermentans]|uniref:uncharacterized protein n=1 Tax=Scheffersomyces xylosifermentans TaxID=1304137 RepID=UPI00315C8351
MAENDSEFSLCDDCLGPDKHLKMIKQLSGEECKSCTRPFAVLRWNTSNSTNKSKKTIICLTCARAKNCCQSCMLDVNYRIPINIRDTALKMAGLESLLVTDTSSTSNREVKAIIADKQDQMFKQQDELDDGELDRREQAKEILTKLSQKLNDDSAKISFKKKTTSSSKSLHTESDKLKNADVSKIVAKLPFGGSLNSQSHPDITSFFIFGISADLPQYAITNLCNTFGKIKSLTVVHRAKCAYVSFTTRASAEAFAESILSNGLNANTATAGLLIIDGKYPVRVSWGKPKSLGVTNEEHLKLSLVVNKVMKQLADKDSAFVSGDSAGTSGTTAETGSKPKKRISSKENVKAVSKGKENDNKGILPPVGAQSKYKSVSADFEI